MREGIVMAFRPKREGKEKIYKTIYLSRELIDAIEKLAADSNTSFNNIVVSMIEYCLDDIDQQNE